MAERAVCPLKCSKIKKGSVPMKMERLIGILSILLQQESMEIFFHKGIHNGKRSAPGRSAFHSSLCRYTISTNCTPHS